MCIALTSHGTVTLIPPAFASFNASLLQQTLPYLAHPPYCQSGLVDSVMHSLLQGFDTQGLALLHSLFLGGWFPPSPAQEPFWHLGKPGLEEGLIHSLVPEGVTPVLWPRLV